MRTTTRIFVPELHRVGALEGRVVEDMTEEAMTSRSMRPRCDLLRLAALLFVVSFSWACGDFGGGSSGGSGSSGPSGFFDLSAQAGGVEAFEDSLYPILRDNCQSCHSGNGPGSPHFAQTNVSSAYQALVSQGKVSLGRPNQSRIVVKVVSLAHHCWTNCAADGALMAAAIQDWADEVEYGSGGVAVEGALASTSLTFDDGVVDTGSERYGNNLIALYEFKEGAGMFARDTSGGSSPVDLQIRDEVEWMSNWGLFFTNGSAMATAEASRKLYNRIADPTTGTQQYTVEAWVTPANIDQEGPARIVSYSRNTGERNFTLGQVKYNYNHRNRSTHQNQQDNGVNGQPALQTDDADRDAQDRLQHVVVTYDQFRGRRIYVDTQFTGDDDPIGASRLWNWDPDHQLVLGNERTSNRRFEGQIRMVAIYKQALTDAQIRKNFEAGVGERRVMRFGVGQWMGAGSFIEFIVSDFDAYSYLFCAPTLRMSSPNNSRIANLRVAVNGVLAASGQGFETIDTQSAGTRHELSRQCSVIPKGPNGGLGDTFTLVFEHLGGFQNLVVQPDVDPADIVLDPDPRPENGIRDFSRVNASFASLTGQGTGVAAATFDEIQEQLPPGYDVRSFVSSQQVAIAKVGLEYCDALVDGPDQATFFPGFDFSGGPGDGFRDAGRPEPDLRSALRPLRR